MIATATAPLSETPYWSQPVTIAELIAETLDWNTRNPDRAGGRLDAIERDLPRGSGIDSGTTIERDNPIIEGWPASSFTLASAWHAMDSNGFYAGWFDFTVEVISTFSGPSVAIEWANGKGPEEDYPCEVIACTECDAGDDTSAVPVAECEECAGTGQRENENEEWAGVSDPSDHIADVFREAMGEIHARIEYDDPPAR